MLLLTDARVYAYDPAGRTYSRASALLIDGTRIVSLDERDAGNGVPRRSLEGATVVPAFADCHVHLTDTGYFLDERNLNRVRSYDEFARAVRSLPREATILAGQYDESFWTDGRSADALPLEHAHSDALAMIVRVDGHSCIVNRRTLDWLALAPDTQGIERTSDGELTGRLFLDANWRAQSAFMASLPATLKRGAEARAAHLALERGYVHLHAQLVGFAREQYREEIAALRALPGVKMYPKICEMDAPLAAKLGLPYVGGDVFLDGSIGSCTAAVLEPYAVAPGGTGSLKYDDDTVYAYFSTAEALGISAGVHAIGDRAIEQCIATWERVLQGRPSSRGNRHFIEHFEIARPEHIEACARMGIHLSMQPQFDLLWGGEGQMYDVRLGTQRMRSMNALAAAERAGAILCGGDDSPVCELSPLEGMQSAADHHEPEQRLSPGSALAMYTYNAASFGHVEHQTGRIAPGFAADFVVLDGDPLDGARFADCAVLQTWSDGICVYQSSS